MAQDTLARVLALSAEGGGGGGTTYTAGAGIAIDESNKISELVPVGVYPETISVDSGIILKTFVNDEGNLEDSYDDIVDEVNTYVTGSNVVVTVYLSDSYFSIHFNSWSDMSYVGGRYKQGIPRDRQGLNAVQFHYGRPAGQNFLRFDFSSASYDFFKQDTVQAVVIDIPNCGKSGSVSVGIKHRLPADYLSANTVGSAGNSNNALYVDSNGNLAAGYLRPSDPLYYFERVSGTSKETYMGLRYSPEQFDVESNTLHLQVPLGIGNWLLKDCTLIPTGENLVYDIPISAISSGLWDAKVDSDSIFRFYWNGSQYYSQSNQKFVYSHTVDFDNDAEIDTYEHSSIPKFVFTKTTTISTGEVTYSAKVTTSQAYTSVRIDTDRPNPYGEPLYLDDKFLACMEKNVVSVTPEVVGTFSGKYFDNKGNTDIKANQTSVRDILSPKDNAITTVTAYEGNYITSLDMSQMTLYCTGGGIGVRDYIKDTDYTLSTTTVGGYTKTDLTFDSSLPIAQYVHIYFWKNYIFYENLKNQNYQIGNNMTGDLVFSSSPTEIKYTIKEDYIPDTIATKAYVDAAIQAALNP